MKHDANVSKVNEPVWFIESKPCQEVPWRSIPKGCISKASTAEVEEGCNCDCYCRGFLHGLVFWWGRLQSILHICFCKFIVKKKKNAFWERIAVITYTHEWNLEVSNLYLNKNERVWIGKGNISKRLRYQPYFLCCTRTWDSSYAALNISITCNICDKIIIWFGRKVK